MIMIDGRQAKLEGSNALLKAELAVAIAQIRSRILSMGLAEDVVDRLIREAVADAKVYELSHVKSEAEMYADVERYY